MGVYDWQTVEVEQPVHSPPTQLTLPERACYPLIDSYVPWNLTSDRIVVPTLRFDHARPIFGFAIFDLRASTVTETAAAGWISGAAWSPTDDLLLITNRHSIRVVTAAGLSVATVLNTDRDSSASITGWTPNGAAFFCLHGSAEASVLRFFDPATGERISEVPIDPASLVPYDAAAYATIDRGPYRLKVDSGTWASAALLDNWSTAEYDAAHSTIRLSVYRPTSAVRTFAQPGGREVIGCEARLVWIAATVVDD